MIRTLAFSVVLALVALPACFNPVSGDYLFTPGETTSDCPDTGGDTGSSEASTVAVAVNDDKSVMTMGDDSSSYDCDLSGRDFTCPMDPIEVDYTDFDMDALVKITFDIGGNWTGNTSFDMDVTATSSCEGADCESVGGVNCSSTGTGSAELVE